MGLDVTPRTRYDSVMILNCGKAPVPLIPLFYSPVPRFTSGDGTAHCCSPLAIVTGCYASSSTFCFPPGKINIHAGVAKKEIRFLGIKYHSFLLSLSLFLLQG